MIKFILRLRILRMKNWVIYLVGESNKMFQDLYDQASISIDELRYLSYDYKNSGSLGRLYLLPKMHKRLSNVPGRPVISNYGSSTEKASEFLDHHLKPIMKAGKSYIRDTVKQYTSWRNLKKLERCPKMLY